ncbi:S-adenosyl-L-methionine-dependent methyltransferase [Dacryopinax primogenitus]|uniref:Protein-lysine N-methyltransferase EFM4 n=1 Tax=Dacryopinax primogenitus (strain DJM 731) TaxID=1858805 RepID=M5GG52_DACPD|nr:S-adenosyl-L-methionine-dependent methyltransferase [Dacryopinax primogenitus]EJU04883.1 S-adenosyl-L-methionine-dependent methyltransferase [Dacryopinax primogenitus]
MTDTDASSSLVDFNPSRLGTKEHWDGVYQREIGSFHEIADEGEVWFGEDVLQKMIDWALENVPPTPDSPYILDIGTGNGVTLFGLAEVGYPLDQLCGIDYSNHSVELARAIAANRGMSQITFKQCDILFDTPAHLENMSDGQGWDLVLDKGTFDAVSLGQYEQLEQPASRLYPIKVGALLKEGGMLLITSCNFTEAEIRNLFETSASRLQFHSHVKHRTFSFGGQTGTVVSTTAFVKTTVSSSA